MHEFKDIHDTPDIEFQRGQLIRYSYNYNWGNSFRGRVRYHVIPLHIHAKDFFKAKQNGLQKTYLKRQVQGDNLPTLSMLMFEIIAE